MGNKLTIGILIDSRLIPAWEYSFIEELRASDYSRISLIMEDVKPVSEDERKTGRGRLIFRLHQKIDELIFLRRNNYAARKDINNILKDVPSIKLSPTIINSFEYFSESDIKEIRKHNPDIILKLSYGFPRGEILQLPKYGVWSYSMKNFTSEREDTTGYYEIIRRNPVTVSELAIIRDTGEGNTVITRTFESTCAYSISFNRDKLFRRASLFVPRVVNGTYKHGHNYLKRLEKKYDKGNSDITGQILAPSFFSSVRSLASSMLIFLCKVFKKIIFTDPFSWILLFRISPDNDFLYYNYRNFNQIKPSNDKFWTDPFVISKGDKYYLFVEEFIYSKNKGHISVLELDKNGLIQNVQKVIEKPYHVSYPFIFEADDVYYMIPETGENRTIDLYKCTEFPDKWIFVKNIMSNVNAVDSTLFFYNNKWWLFTLIDKIDNFLGGSPELFLFYTDDFLSGKWTGHALNPVVTDVRSARPAGKIFIKEGEIYRPSQNCAGRYGNSFDINRVLILTETDYREEKVIKVRPDWDSRLQGTHTFNFDGDFTVIDAYSLRRRFMKIFN